MDMKKWNNLKQHVAKWKANGCRTIRHNARNPKTYTPKLEDFGTVEALMQGKTIRVMG